MSKPALALTEEEIALVLARRRNRLRDAVAAYLREHPDASANEVARELRGRRKEILALVRETTGRGTDASAGRFPARGNHGDDGVAA